MAEDRQLNPELAIDLSTGLRELLRSVTILEKQVQWMATLGDAVSFDASIPPEVRDRVFAGQGPDSASQLLHDMKQQIDALLGLIQVKD